MKKKIIIAVGIVATIILATLLVTILRYYWELNTPFNNLGEDDLSQSEKMLIPSEQEEDQTFPPPNCNVLTSHTVPLKDKQTFIDTEYTQVTTTAREYWDKKQLPPKVLELEKKNYTCYPMPFEMNYGEETPGMHIQPEVKSVQWTCELEYNDFRYLETNKKKEKEKLESEGFICEKQNCLDNQEKEKSVFFCSR